MRRNTSNKSSLILIVLVAIFTLMSYAFDQLAVQTEDTIRKTSIKLDNQKIKIYKLNSLISDIGILRNNTEVIVKNSLIIRNLWIKSLLINKKIKKGEIQDVFENLDYSEEQIIKGQLIDAFVEKMSDNWNMLNKLYQFYGRNKEYLIDINLSDLDKQYGIEEIINRNKDKLRHKDMKYIQILYERYWEGQNRVSALKNFDLDHWLDIHFLTIKMIQNIHEGGKKYLLPNVKLLDKLTSEERQLRKSVINDLQKATTYKNQFILLSIISQILSLLFLLLFFKLLIRKNTL